MYSGPGKKYKRKAKKSRRSVVVRILLSAIGLVLVVLALFGLGLLLIVQQPAEYKPRILTNEEKVWANELGTTKFEQLFNQSQDKEKFTLSIEQQLVNALLMMDDLEPWGYRRNFSGAAKHFQDAQVAFDNDSIFLMGRITYEGINTVLTITLEPKITPEGKLQISLVSVKAGALKVPSGIVNKQLENLLRTQKLSLKQGDSGGGKKHYYIDGKELSDSLGEITVEISSQPQVEIDAAFLSTVDTQIRIESIEIKPGQLELAIQPKYIDK